MKSFIMVCHGTKASTGCRVSLKNPATRVTLSSLGVKDRTLTGLPMSVPATNRDPSRVNIIPKL